MSLDEEFSQEELNRRIERLLYALLPHKPERIYLFGSVARGEADALNDLDVVVIQRTETPFLERVQQVGRSLPFDVGAVDSFVYTPDEFTQMLHDGNAFAQLIAEKGVLLYDGPAEG